MERNRDGDLRNFMHEHTLEFIQVSKYRVVCVDGKFMRKCKLGGKTKTGLVAS
jgi:hypothetical protein